MTFFVGVIDGGVFLLLESNGEAEIAVLLGESGVVVGQHRGDGGFASGAVVHEGGCAMIRLLEEVHQLGCTNTYLQTAKCVFV
jgi:hypothetical protein